MTKTITVGGQSFNEFTASVNGTTTTFCALMDRNGLRRNSHFFLPVGHYDGILAGLKKLSGADRKVLLDVELIAQTPPHKRNGLTSPLETMSREQREAFDDRLRKADLSLSGNVLAVNHDDLRGMGYLRRQPVYNVGGRPVPAANMTPQMVAAVQASQIRLQHERARGTAIFRPA